jgi:hypothetical protein
VIVSPDAFAVGCLVALLLASVALGFRVQHEGTGKWWYPPLSLLCAIGGIFAIMGLAWLIGAALTWAGVVA